MYSVCICLADQMFDKVYTWLKGKLALVSIALAISVREQAGMIFKVEALLMTTAVKSADFFSKLFCVDGKASFLTCASFL